MTILKRNNALFPSVLDQFLHNSWPVHEGVSDGAATIPAVNIKENKEAFVLELAVPGFTKENLKVNVKDNYLTLSAEVKEEQEQNEEKYTRKEFNYKAFKRSFSLPELVNADAIEAKFENGILFVNIPKLVEKEEIEKQILIQ